MQKTLDSTDFAILRALKQNSRLSVRELAAQVHRSPTPVFERLRRLEESGIIKGYTTIVDDEQLGRGFTVFCNVKLRHINRDIHINFARLVADMPEVVECFNVSGSFDYMLRVQVADMKSYRRFITDKLGLLDMLDSVESVFVMEQVKTLNQSGFTPEPQESQK